MNRPPIQPHRRFTARRHLLAATIAACYATAPVWALPTAPVVANGSATFAQNGNVLNVTNSNGAIINWNTFNIGANETTRFIQSSASSAVLNRVVTADPSRIYGTLSSNGQVWLINTSGIMVGPSGRIDTAGFVASTLDVSNQDFLARRLNFQNTPGAGSVLNQGAITTPDGGTVYLIGANVGNEGVITTPNGETILAAGQTVDLVDTATPGVKVTITGAAGDATNLGSIVAEAGRIGMAGVMVRNSGQLNASSVINEGGRVFLRASRDTYVDGAGRIVATGRKGGSVEVLGERVAVMDRAEIDVSGRQGGGSALVGGDLQGKNPDVRNATATYLGQQARIAADATERGDGGKVIVWADGTTRAYGTVTARGGAGGGNGGFAEISGKQSLDFAARVDLWAPQGKTGTLLLDPSSIDIYAGSGTDGYGGGTLGGTPWLLSAGTGGATIYGATIYSALLTADLVLTTGDGGTGNITVHSGTYSADSANTNNLTLLAYGGNASIGNVSVAGAAINLYGGGLNIVAGWDGNTDVYTSAAMPVVVADTGKGNIAVDDSAIFAGSVKWLAAGNLTVSGTNVGSVVQSSGHMWLAANNIYLTGGSANGAGVKVEAVNGPQEIAAANEIKLQAGSANNDAYGGSPVYGGSVILKAGSQSFSASQSIAANALRLIAGSGGHDNAAMIEAWGTQTIVLGSPTTPAVLEIVGGGTNAAGVYGSSVAGAWYGGASTTAYGSYNNFAQITQEAWGGGSQLFIIYGGSVSLQAGNGNGINGLTDDCYHWSNHCNDTPSSSNWAQIYNWGHGGAAGHAGVSQAFEFHATTGSPGSIVLRGGANGSNNKAEIVNDPGTGGSTSQYIGAAAPADYPNIALYGGTSGGYVDAAYGQFVHNGAEIASYANQNSADGVQVIYGGTIALYGGDSSSGLAPAIIDAAYQTITTTGDLILVGGASTVSADTSMGGAEAFIGNKLGGSQSINVGNDLIMTGGSGYYGSASIGSGKGTANADIVVGGNVTLTANAGAVRIGSVADAGYGGASIDLRANGNVMMTGSATRGVSIGSFNDDAAATDVGIVAGGNLVAAGNDGGVYIGVSNPSGAYGSSVALAAGATYAGATLAASSTGGDISLSDTHVRTGANAAGMLTIKSHTGTAAYGDIAFTDAALEGWGGVNLTAARHFSLTGVDRGVLLESHNGMTVDVGGNLTLTGSTLATAYGDNSINDPSLGAGAFMRNMVSGSQDVTVAGNIVMTAGAVDNGANTGSAFYGGSVVIANWAENGSQSVAAHGIAMYGGSGGHDNMAAIMAKGSQTIAIEGGQLYMAGGSGAGSYNNNARIEQTYGGAPQRVTVHYGGAIVMYGGSATGTGGWNGGAASGAEIYSYGGAAATQTIDFYDAAAYGSLTLVGGSAGTENRAGINGGYGSQWIGNSYGGPAPNIRLVGGSGGGTANHENGAEIDIREFSTGTQTVYAGDIDIAGGTATYGGAGFGGPTQDIHASGNVTLAGGTSSAYDTVEDTPGSAAYIGSQYGADIQLDVGGDLTLQGGSGYGGMVLIGSLREQAAVAITVDGDVSITAGAAGTGKVAVGSLATATYGAGVAIIAGGDLGLYGGAAGISIGAHYGGVADHVWLGAGALGNVNATSGYGGSIATSGDVLVKSYGDVALKAYRAGTSPYGGGNVALGAGGRIVGGTGIDVLAQGDALLDGSLTAAAGYGASVAAGSGAASAKTLRVADVYGDSITLTATGDVDITGTVDARTSFLSVTAGQNGYGGSVSLGSGSSVSAYGGMDLYAYYGAGAGGGIAQTGGSLTSATASVNLHADRAINLAGNVTGVTGANLSAGISSYGGDLTISGIIDGGSGAATLTSGSGSIHQTAGTVYGAGATAISVSAYGDALMDGTLTAASGGVHVAAGNANSVGKILRVASVTGDGVTLMSSGNVVVAGDVTSRIGSVAITAGSVGVAGGDIDLGSGHAVSGYGGIALTAHTYGGSVGGGIVQTSGNLTSTNGSIVVDADRAIGLGGTVSGSGGVTVDAGKAAYGGDVAVGDVSSTSGHVHLQSHSGTLQTSGIVYGGTYVEAYAYGGALIGGTVTSPGTVTLKSGYDGATVPTAYNLEIAGDIYGGTVNVEASGAILDSLTNGTTQGNVFADSASFTSRFGGAATGLAISADTRVTGSLSATVMGTATYGGIDIRNTGTAAPTSVSLHDNAPLYGKVGFKHSGSDLTLDSGMSFGAYGDIAVLAQSNAGYGGNLNYQGATLSSTAGSILLGADQDIHVNSMLSVGSADLGLTAGGGIDIDALVYGNNVAVVAPTVNIYGWEADSSGHIDADNDIAIVAPTAFNMVGGDVYSYNGRIAITAGNVDLDQGYIASHGGTTVTANSLTGYGASIHAYAVSGDIAITVANDIRWNDGSAIVAGNDVRLTLSGATSRLYLNDGPGYASPSYVIANSPDTIHLTFTQRSTDDGVVIDGVTTTTSTANGSGLFVRNHSTPASASDGLALGYTAVTTTVVTPTDVIATVNDSVSTRPADTADDTGPSQTKDLGSQLLPSQGGSQTTLSFGGNQTIGGGANEFGGTEPAPAPAPVASLAPAPAPESEKPAPAAATADKAPAATEKEPAKEPAAAKETKDSNGKKDEEKKEDKKDDKKSAASEGDKKDDKASGKKPLGKCSA